MPSSTNASALQQPRVPLPRPPTSNTLDPLQRARLLRTARKLGAVLGTTPLLLEPTEEIQYTRASFDTLPSRNRLPIGPVPPPRASSSLSHYRSTSASTSSIALAPVHPYARSQTHLAALSQPPRAHSSLGTHAVPRSSTDSSSSGATNGYDSEHSIASAPSTPNPYSSLMREPRSFSRGRGFRTKKRKAAPAPLVLRVAPAHVSPDDPRLPLLSSGSDTESLKKKGALKDARAPLSPSNRNRSRHRKGSMSTSSFLTLDTPAPGAETRASLILSPGTIASATPLTPSFRFRAPHIPRARRAKLAKLTRQLGENVPPGLVFPHLVQEALPPIPMLPLTTTSTLDNSSRPAPAPAPATLSRTTLNPSTQAARTRRRRSASVGQLSSLSSSLQATLASGSAAPAPITIRLPVKGEQWEPPAEWAGPAFLSTPDLLINGGANARSKSSDVERGRAASPIPPWVAKGKARSIDVERPAIRRTEWEEEEENARRALAARRLKAGAINKEKEAESADELGAEPEEWGVEEFTDVMSKLRALRAGK